MSQIQTHCRADNARLRIKPGAAGPKPMSFKTNKCTDRQTNMIALRDFEPVLAMFNSGELFETTMVDLNLPGIQSMKGSLLKGHVQAAGCPIFRVAVFADRPKYLDPAIPFVVNQAALRWDKDLANCAVAAAVKADFPIALQLGQPVPFKAALQLEIRQSTIPTVKYHQLGLKAALLGLSDHMLKVIVLAQPVFHLVVQSKIARQSSLTIRPNQRDQVDALHYGMMLTRPVPTDQSHLRRIRFVQLAVVDDQHTTSRIHQRLHFLPQRLTIRWQPLQQARICVVRWRLSFSRMGLRGFNTAKYILGGYQKVDVIHFIAFGWVHASSLACSLPIA